MKRRDVYRAVSALGQVAAAGLAAMPAVALAEEVPVASVDELLSAISGAQPGDEIILASGTYAISQNVDCAAVGSPDLPIVVRAEEPLGAEIVFDALEGFRVNGAHWRFVDLAVRGACAVHSDCEHAFHVVGAAHGFVMQGCRVQDFNAQLKVNASQIGGTWTAPDDGLIAGCELFDSEPRQTDAPVTKLNIDGGKRWVVRDSSIHDFTKAGGNGVSYGAFMKSGGEDGLFERNLVVCSTTGDTNGTRIGLSFGGGGTAPQFCAPAYDAAVPCSVEHAGGTLRNNIIATCTDVGIYLNRAADTRVLFNTLVGTTGIDFRFDTTTGLAHGNLLASAIRDRDGGTHTEGTNLVDVAMATFDGWYTEPAQGDLSLAGDTTPLHGQAAPDPGVTDDYCVRARPSDMLTLGALEHTLGDCDTIPPPGPGSGGGGDGGAGDGGGAQGGEAAAGGGPSGSGGGPGEGGGGADGDGGEDGCDCAAAGHTRNRFSTVALLGLAIAMVGRRRRRGS